MGKGTHPHSEMAFLSSPVLSLECDTNGGNGLLWDHADGSEQSGRLFGVFIQQNKNNNNNNNYIPTLLKPKLCPCVKLLSIYTAMQAGQGFLVFS